MVKNLKAICFFLYACAVPLVLAACTTQNTGHDSPAQLGLASKQPKDAAQIAFMGSPLSFGYSVDSDVPVPLFRENAYAANNANTLASRSVMPLTATLTDSKKSDPVVLTQASGNVESLITKYAEAYDVPEALVRRVVKRESNGNPQARNGPYWGLMQISHPTAKGMGYDGRPEGLLDAETNLRYAVKYLAGAYQVAGGNENQAVRYYARGYYYDAKAKGMLEETGLRPGPNSPTTAFEAINMTSPTDGKTKTDYTTLGGVPVPAARPMD